MHVNNLIQKHFADGLSKTEIETMQFHLRLCENCRVEYDRISIILRGAAQKTPTKNQMEFLRQSILDRLEVPKSAAPKSFMLPRLVPALVTGLAIVLGVWIYLVQKDSNEPNVQLKGGKQVVRPLVDFEVVAIRSHADGSSKPRFVPNGGNLVLDEYVQFRYQNNDPQIKYLYLVGQDNRQEPLDYYPRPTEYSSIPIVESSQMKTIDRSIRLSVRHGIGSLKIFAIFSLAPLNQDAIHQCIKAQQFEGNHLTCFSDQDFVRIVVKRFTIIKKKEDEK